MQANFCCLPTRSYTQNSYFHFSHFPASLELFTSPWMNQYYDWIFMWYFGTAFSRNSIITIKRHPCINTLTLADPRASSLSRGRRTRPRKKKHALSLGCLFLLQKENRLGIIRSSSDVTQQVNGSWWRATLQRHAVHVTSVIDVGT